MSKIRTDQNLKDEFHKKLHNWQCKKLLPIEDLSYVILNLLKVKFVVEINGDKYDIYFGKNNETDEIGYGWSSYPSPHLLSYEIIEKAFKEGKWYKVTNENLPKKETEEILKQAKEKEYEEMKNFLKEVMEELYKQESTN